MTTHPSERPVTRTFKPRRRQVAPARQEMFERMAPVWMLETEGAVLDLDEVFGRRGSEVVLDVGYGSGEALSAMASAQPGLDVIGCDVFTPGLVAVLGAIEAHSLGNVRLVDGDVLDFLPRLAPSSLVGVRVYFPDPWPKARHHRRRLISPPILDQLVARLRPAGWLHLATDIEDYADQMQRVCDAHPDLTGGPIARPDWRPITRYEQKGIDAGRTARDFWYITRRSSAG